MPNRYTPRDGYRWYEYGPCAAPHRTNDTVCGAQPGERCRDLKRTPDQPVRWLPTAHPSRPRRRGGWPRPRRSLRTPSTMEVVAA